MIAFIRTVTSCLVGCGRIEMEKFTILGGCVCGPAFFNVRPHSMGETHFFCFTGKPFKKKNDLESPLIFVLF